MFDDDDFQPVKEDLSAMPQGERAEYLHLRDLAALKGVVVRFEPTADGLPSFAVTRYGETVRQSNATALKTALVAAGVPLISQQELRQRAEGLEVAFGQAVDDAMTPHLDH